MKKLFKTSFVLLSLLSVLFVSCRKDYEVPPIPVIPEGRVYTIGDLLAMPSNTSFDTASVYGIVTADEQSGNLYKTIFIQDRATGKAIELLMNTSSAARIGDSVRVCLDKNMMVNNYHNLPQLVGKDGKGFNPDGHLIIYPYNKPIDPDTATIADIKSGKYLAGLVRLVDVEFVDQGSPFCNVGENTNRTLKDATGELIVRTSNYANFAYDPIPTGKGTLVAIASVYNSDWQLILRSKNEMKFEGDAPTPPANPGEVQSLPYTQSFSSEFGTYTTFNVSGTQTWTIDYNTAKMTGYESSTNYANEDWLISSPVDLTKVTDAKMTMTYIGRYFNKINDDITIWASTDYTFGNDPTTATWTQVPSSFSEGTNWTDFLTSEISLTQFAGQTVTFAVKYLSNDTKAGTIEIQSIAIEEGGGDTPTPPAPSGEVQNIPYSQSFETEFGTYTTYDALGAQKWVIDFKTAKMSGYDGSAYDNEDWLISSPVNISGIDHAKAVFNYAAKYSSSNSNDITVQVSSNYQFGTDPYTATWTELSASFANNNKDWNFDDLEVSLDDYIGQTVNVAVKYTSTTAGARTIEIKSITIEEGSGDNPTPPTPSIDPINVATGIELQGQDVVAWVQGYIVGAVKAGNTNVSDNDQINWVAPFDIATNVLIADDPTCQEISQCIIVNLPAGKPLRTQVNLMDHPENLGKTLAVNGKLRTYFGQAGLRDSGGTEDDFVLEGGETPPTPTGIFSETFANGQGDFTIQDVAMPASGLTFVWKHNTYQGDKFMKGSAYYQQAYEAESWLVSPGIDLAGVGMATLTFDHAVNFASPQGRLFVMISADYTGDVTTATWTELDMSAWPVGSNYDFLSTTADLTPYVGQTVTIAFKYTSEGVQGSCPTWQVKNIVVE